MAHKLIVGQTLSGKSTLAKAFVAEAVTRGIVPVIYDPTLSYWGDNVKIVTADENEFMRALMEVHESGKSAFVVIDEADTMLSMSHRHNWWLFMRGRHFGFELCAITQRPNNIAPSVRGNAPEIYVFQLGKKDAVMLADDYGAEGLEVAEKLYAGEFLRAYWKDRKKVVDKCRIF